MLGEISKFIPHGFLRVAQSGNILLACNTDKRPHLYQIMEIIYPDFCAECGEKDYDPEIKEDGPVMDVQEDALAMYRKIIKIKGEGVTRWFDKSWASLAGVSQRDLNIFSPGGEPRQDLLGR